MINLSHTAVKAIWLSPHKHKIFDFGGGSVNRFIRTYILNNITKINWLYLHWFISLKFNFSQKIPTKYYPQTNNLIIKIFIWNQINMNKIATLLDTANLSSILLIAHEDKFFSHKSLRWWTIRFRNLYKNQQINEQSPLSALECF